MKFFLWKIDKQFLSDQWPVLLVTFIILTTIIFALSTDQLLNISTTAFGAFAGAGMAFLLNIWKTKVKEKNNQYSSLVKTQFILMGYLHQTLQILKLFNDAFNNFDKIRSGLDQDHRYFKARAIETDVILHIDLKSEIKIDEVCFLLEQHQYSKNLPNKILEVHIGYNYLLDLLDIRNQQKLEINKVIRLLDRSNLSVENIDSNAPDIVGYLTDLTNKIPKSCQELLEEICNTLNELTNYIDNAYIPKKSIPMGIDETNKFLLPIDHPLFLKIKWYNKATLNRKPNV